MQSDVGNFLPEEEKEKGLDHHGQQQKQQSSPSRTSLGSVVVVLSALL